MKGYSYNGILYSGENEMYVSTRIHLKNNANGKKQVTEKYKQ